jgi:hypothetical protein
VGTIEGQGGIRLSDEQRLDWLRLIRSENVKLILLIYQSVNGRDARVMSNE